jgi:hypothetical protein
VGKTYVVMELAAEGDLEQYLSARGALPDTGALDDRLHSWFRQCLLAVQYLCQHGYRKPSDTRSPY